MKINLYAQLVKQQQDEFDSFPIFFAFSNSQFENGMKGFGLSVNDTDKIYHIGYGGYIRKTDSSKFANMMDRHDNELKQEIEKDLTGDGFILDMFDYELDNHEYAYTMNLEDTLDSLCLTMDDIVNNSSLLNGLNLARKKHNLSARLIVKN